MNIKIYDKRIRVQPAIAADADDLAPILRPADLAEIQAIPGISPRPDEALRHGIMVSDNCFVALDIPSGLPICLFGATKVTEEYGAIWLMGSHLLDKHKWLFLRESRNWVHSFHQVHPALGNLVLDTNTLHINWLRWLGFTFIKHHQNYGRNGEGFFEFVKVCAIQP